MTRRRLVLVAFAVVIFATVYLVRIGEDMVDFEVNFRAGERIVAGETLYQTGDGHFMFKYFPFAALLYAPLTVVPLGAAKALWYLLSVTATVALFFVARSLVSGNAVRPWWSLAVAPLVLAKFCFRELKLGQINTVVTLVLLFMVVCLVAAGRRRDTRAGALWGLATALKPYGFVFFPYFVVTRNWRALAGGMGVLSAAFVLPSMFYGLEKNVVVHREWYTSLQASTPSQLGVADNVSLIGAFTKWSGDPELSGRLALVCVAILASLVLVVIYRGRGQRRAPVLECALLLTLIPLVSPMGWDYQFLTSVLALTLLADRFLELPARWFLAANLAVIGLSIYDLVGRAAYQAFMNASILTVCFVVVVAYLVTLRLRRLA
jgi:alpha-1,2-mannosyltransferase